MWSSCENDIQNIAPENIKYCQSLKQIIFYPSLFHVISKLYSSEKTPLIGKHSIAN